MKVFVSWSGPLSKGIALELREWLPNVLQGLEVFMSSEDIRSGSRWFEDGGRQLQASDFGVIVTTRANQQAAWLLFEAGALSKTLARASVAPLLVDLTE